MSDDLNRGIKELIARYKKQLEEKDAEIARLSHDNSILVGFVSLGGELRELPTSSGYDGVI